MERRKGESARDYLERIPSFAKKKSTRPEVRAFLGLMGNPDRKFRIFHVAGTNGKGSVCAFLTAALLEAEKTCGTLTSPHLSDIRERFLINGRMVPEEAFLAAFEAVYGYVSKWEAAGHAHPTYFEFLFYMGLFLFSEAETEFLVLETGMGGRYDVTNVIEEPLVSVITSVSIDHTAFLGTTVPEIAAHKAGIIKSGRPVVYDTVSEEAAQVIAAEAERLLSSAYPVEDVPFSCVDGKIGISCSYLGREETFVLPFAAPYQAKNGALAVKALEVSGLHIPADVLRAGLLKAKWPARMEEVRPGIFLDGAHNGDGMRAFLDAACLIKEMRKPERTLFLFAVSADKDFETMLSEAGRRLSPSVCFLARMESHRALSLSALLETAERLWGKKVLVRGFETTKEALSALFSLKQPGDLAFIAGSLYLAGEIKKETEHD